MNGVGFVPIQCEAVSGVGVIAKAVPNGGFFTNLADEVAIP